MLISMFKKTFVLFFIILSLNACIGSNVKKNELIKVFESVRLAEPGQRPYFYTRKYIAYRLGTIIEETSDEGILHSVNINSNVMNLTGEVETIVRYELFGDNKMPILSIIYKDSKDSKGDEKELRLGFEKVDNSWLISNTVLNNT